MKYYFLKYFLDIFFEVRIPNKNKRNVSIFLGHFGKCYKDTHINIINKNSQISPYIIHDGFIIFKTHDNSRRKTYERLNFVTKSHFNFFYSV